MVASEHDPRPRHPCPERGKFIVKCAAKPGRLSAPKRVCVVVYFVFGHDGTNHAIEERALWTNSVHPKRNRPVVAARERSLHTLRRYESPSIQA